jgi:capsular polysaccharide biosynthesis protein
MALPDRLVTLTEPKRFERMIVPSSSYNLFTSVANAQAETWERIGRALGREEGPDRVYLSRSQFPYNQRVANETEVEQRFRSWGFTIVYPEQHTTAEQITLIRDARYVAGNAGSAMYLSAFARLGINKLVIAPLNFAFRDDQLISHVRGDSFSYFLCQPGPDTNKGPRKTVYHVALERLDEAIAQWIS